ncbi:hypothetical protein BURCENK562V_C6158 [Burkholderia cenocepacia K56-2Valvano]|nr:hypothetical protein BURCENK562V_C6158 [Burkholderia cenocepacia K56-2Valvano]
MAVRTATKENRQAAAKGQKRAKKNVRTRVDCTRSALWHQGFESIVGPV